MTGTATPTTSTPPNPARANSAGADAQRPRDSRRRRAAASAATHLAKTVASKRDAAITGLSTTLEFDLSVGRHALRTGREARRVKSAERDESRSASGACAAMSDDDVRAKFDGVKAKLVEYKTLKKIAQWAAQRRENRRVVIGGRGHRRRTAAKAASPATSRRTNVAQECPGSPTPPRRSRRCPDGKGALDEEKGAALADIFERHRRDHRENQQTQRRVTSRRSEGASRSERGVPDAGTEHAERERETKERKETHSRARDALEREVKALERVFADAGGVSPRDDKSALDDARVRARSGAWRRKFATRARGERTRRRGRREISRRKGRR